jgi:SAM-dependent methyltransferase
MDAQAGTLATTRFEQASFAAVVMSHSLEHVVAPRDDLARVYGLLRPGGVVAIALPNFASWQRRRFRDRWFALDLPRHRVHFVPAALEQALTEAGFSTVTIGSSGNAGIMVASWQYRRFGRLVLAEGAGFLIGYALALALSPVTAVLDRIDGEGPILYAVAYRPAPAD